MAKFNITLEMKRIFFVTVPKIATYTEHEIRTSGPVAEYIDGVPIKNSYMELTRVRLPYDEIVNIALSGMALGFPVESDAVRIYDHTAEILSYIDNQAAYGLNTITLDQTTANSIREFESYMAESFRNLITKTKQDTNRFRTIGVIPMTANLAGVQIVQDKKIIVTGRRTRFSDNGTNERKPSAIDNQTYNHNDIYRDLPDGAFGRKNK